MFTMYIGLCVLLRLFCIVVSVSPRKELQIEMDEITSEAKTYEPASFSENLFPEANHYIAILQQQKSMYHNLI